MTIDRYLLELGGALHVRGAARRRFLRECRDHLADAAAERGSDEAVRAFGPPSEVAAAFDAEVAARRGVRSTFVTVAGVLATGGSTLALIHATSANATAPVWWAIPSSADRPTAWRYYCAQAYRHGSRSCNGPPPLSITSRSAIAITILRLALRLVTL